MWHHKLRRGGVLGAKLLADVGNPDGAGIAGLPQDITINGTTVSPTFRYEGKDASLSSWTPVVGETLTAAGSGGRVGLYAPTPDDTARVVSGDSTLRWQASDTSFGQIGTGDFVFECLIYPRYAGLSRYILGTRHSSAGWLLFDDSGANLKIFIQDASGFSQQFAPISYGAFYHYIVFGDRSGSMQPYINGDAVGPSISISARNGSLDSGLALTIGGRTGGGLAASDRIAYAAMWQRDNWLDTHLQADLAQERFARLTGTYVPGWQAWPTQANLRNSVATIQRRVYGAEYQLFAVGQRWPRLENIRDAETDRDIDGVVSNSFARSEDFTTAGWGTLRASVATGTGVYDHTGKTEMQGLVATAVADFHALYSDLTPSDTHKHIFVAEFSPGRTDAVRMQSVNQAAADVWVQFGLRGDGVVGVSSAGVLALSITKLATDRYRCVMVYEGGTANHRHALAPIGDETVASITYTGDGVNADLYLTAAQHDYSEETDGRESFAEYVRTVGVGRIVGKPGNGFMCEGQHTNLIPYSEEFDNAAWTKTNCSVTANSIAAPNGETTADTFVEDGTASSVHEILETILGTSVADYTFYVFAKAANRQWIRLYVQVAVTGTVGRYFDVASGILGGTVGTAPDDSIIRYIGNGWYFCSISFNADLGGNMNARIGIADSDGGGTFNGLFQDSLYLWGAQVTETPYPVSYIKTEGATVTRLGDRVVYAGLPIPSNGTISFDGLESRGGRHFCNVNVGGSTSSRVQLAEAATGRIGLSMNDGGILQCNVLGAINGYLDNVWQEARGTYETDDIRLYESGILSDSDSLATVPSPLSYLEFGGYSTPGFERNGRVRVRLFNKPTLKDPTEFK